MAGVDVGTVPPELGSHAGLVRRAGSASSAAARNQAAAEFNINEFISADAEIPDGGQDRHLPVNPALGPRLAETPVIKI